MTLEEKRRSAAEVTGGTSAEPCYALAMGLLREACAGGRILEFGAGIVSSGFCIHLPIAGKGRMIDCRAYALRSFFRIYPAYFATLLLCLAGAGILFWQGVGQSPALSEYATSAFMLQNWVSGHQVGW
jgi:hypothetical protein